MYSRWARLIRAQGGSACSPDGVSVCVLQRCVTRLTKGVTSVGVMKTASWGKICTFWQQFTRSERFPLWRHANPLKHPQHSCRCSPLLKRRCDWQFLSVVTDLPSSPLRRLNAPDSSRGSPSDRGVTCTPPRVTLAGECGFLFVLFAYLTHVGPWSQNGVGFDLRPSVLQRNNEHF